MSKSSVFIVYTLSSGVALIGGAFLTIEDADQCVTDQHEDNELTHGDPVKYNIMAVPLVENLFRTEPMMLCEYH